MNGVGCENLYALELAGTSSSCSTFIWHTCIVLNKIRIVLTLSGIQFLKNQPELFMTQLVSGTTHNAFYGSAST